MPRWLQARPFLFAGVLSWSNFQRQHKAVLPALTVLLLISGGLLAFPVVGHLLEVVAAYPVTPFVLLAAACAVATVHRKTSVYRSLADSWLAPLAAPPSILIRMALVPVLQLILLVLAIGVPALVGSLSLKAAVTLWSVVGAAYVAGFLVGWLASHDKSAGAPAFHYVTVRKPRACWAQAPQLEPLSYWAMGQTRVSTKPKVTAGAVLFVLLALPMGTGGGKAVAIAAGAWVVLHLAALDVSAIRVAFAAARWLAPTTVRYMPFTVSLGYRAVVAQLWACGWVVFLTCGVALTGALRIGLISTAGCLISSCGAIAFASWLAMRSAGMVGERGAMGGGGV
jgi:hypothetical protein